MEPGSLAKQVPGQASQQRGGGSSSGFAVGAHQLVLAGHFNDSRLDRGMAAGFGQQPCGGHAHFPQAARATVRQRCRCPECRREPRGRPAQDVGHHVARPTRRGGLLAHLQHRDGRLRGNARYSSPDELIQHVIAQHTDSPARETGTGTVSDLAPRPLRLSSDWHSSRHPNTGALRFRSLPFQADGAEVGATRPVGSPFEIQSRLAVGGSQ